MDGAGRDGCVGKGDQEIFGLRLADAVGSQVPELEAGSLGVSSWTMP